MLLKLIKGFQPTSLILIIITSIALWLKVFFDETNNGIFIDSHPMILYEFVMNFFTSIDLQFINKTLALILVIIQAGMVAAINNQYQLIGYRSYLPFFIFFLLIINFNDFLLIHPIYFANILFLTAWIRIKKAHGKQNAISNYFDASFLIGLASLFYFNYIYLIVILLINILISRPGNIKEFSISIIGAMLVLYLFSSLNFITNGEYINISNLFIISPGFTDFSSLSTTFIITGIYFILLSLLASFTLFKYYISLNINVRNNLKLFFYLFILGISIVIFTNSSLELIYLIAIPLSLFLSLFFINIRNNLLGNVLLILMIISTIINIYFANYI